MIESRCGILCSECRFTECKGCINIANPFWGSCPVKVCCEQKNLEHCGECDEFPCELLKSFSFDEKEGDGGKRIEQCEKWKYIIRKFEIEDADEVSALIAKTLRTTNIKDYSKDYIENDVKQLSPSHVIERAKWTHFYVVCNKNTIIGCGAIGPYWGKEDESSLFTIFVLPEYQGKGVGRKIIETLEQDEFFLRAKRIEIPASITACGFYKKMGYDYKNGIDSVDDELLYRMEKFR